MYILELTEQGRQMTIENLARKSLNAHISLENDILIFCPFLNIKKTVCQLSSGM